MKKKNRKILILFLYILVVTALYVVMIYPAIKKPKVTNKSNVPTLSVSGINEINQLFAKLGKTWGQIAVKPNINSYIYGQADPM